MDVDDEELASASSPALMLPPSALACRELVDASGEEVLLAPVSPPSAAAQQRLQRHWLAVKMTQMTAMTQASTGVATRKHTKSALMMIRRLSLVSSSSSFFFSVGGVVELIFFLEVVTSTPMRTGPGSRMVVLLL